jgi:Bacterial tandem repeat domain 1
MAEDWIRVRFIPTANDDGTEAIEVKVDDVEKSIAHANATFGPAGIQFYVDVTTDIEHARHNTLLNHDFTVPSGIDLTDPATKDGPEFWGKNSAEKDRIGRQYLGQIVAFVNTGRRLRWRPELGRWVFEARGGSSSSGTAEFILMTFLSGNDSVAHEIGHYLHLQHPHTGEPQTVAEAARQILDFVASHNIQAERGAEAFDADSFVVGDTPPDPGHELFRALGLDPCNPDHATAELPVTFPDGRTITFHLTPDRRNIMNYWDKECLGLGRSITPDQITSVRTALYEGNRRHLIESRLCVDAIYEADDHHQTFVLGWSRSDLAVRFDREQSFGRYLVQMWAYEVSPGEIRFDAVWEPGPRFQSRAFTWALEHLAPRMQDEINAGRHVAHMQAFGGSEPRWAVVWELGSSGQTVLNEWAIDDLTPRIQKELASGNHVAHLQGYAIGNGEVRWDAIFEPGDHDQTVVNALSLSDFTAVVKAQLGSGKHVAHMRAYDVGNGEVRWDAIFEPLDRDQSLVISWAPGHFLARYDSELAAGRHLVHLQAFDVGGGQTRWDGIFEPGRKDQSRSFSLQRADFEPRLTQQLAAGRHIVHLQSYVGH